MDTFSDLLKAARKSAHPQRLVRNAHLLRLKKRLRLTPEQKYAYCAKCYSLSHKTRIRKGIRVRTCTWCGKVRRNVVKRTSKPV